MSDLPIKVADPAPDFSLPAQSGERIHLADFRGRKWVVLYFYPKDETLGCTAEACAFRDSYTVFQEAGAEVIGVSSDSVDSHRRFAAEHRLPFLLLSDTQNEVRRLYGVPSTYGLLPGRVTYIIDKQGRVRHIFDSQFNPPAHVQEALRILNSHPQTSTSPN